LENATFVQILWSKCFIFDNILKNTWPASHEKGPLDISHSVGQDQPLYNVENTYINYNKIVYIAKKISAIDVIVVKSADLDQTRRRRCGGWSGSTLFAHVRRSLFA